MLDLDRLDIDFEPGTDEVGRLATLLGDLAARLRTSTARVREAERRATVGDLARQVGGSRQQVNRVLMTLEADGSIERLASGGAVLGVFPDATYEQAQVPLRSGDRIVLYTDGITEARSADDEEFGDERLAALAVQERGCSAPALQARIAEAVASFTGGRFQDDATVIVMSVD